MLRWICDATRLDRVRVECIKGSLDITNTANKMKENRLKLFRYAERKNNGNVLEKIGERRIRKKVCQRKKKWGLLGKI